HPDLHAFPTRRSSDLYQQNVRAVQESPAQIYDLLVSDLKQALMLLPDDYTTSNGERIRPNTYSAYALLARVYLYQQKWQQAAIRSEEHTSELQSRENL